VNDAEYAFHLGVSKLADRQRAAVWAYHRTPRWRFLARWKARAVAYEADAAWRDVMKVSANYWNEKAAKA